MKVQQTTFDVLLVPRLKLKLPPIVQVVKFALAGLSNAKSMKYGTALQLYNLEHDNNGKAYTLQEIEKKFFKADEKTTLDVASLCIASGHAVYPTHTSSGSYKKGNNHCQQQRHHHKEDHHHANKVTF